MQHQAISGKIFNWAGNYQYSTQQVYYPTSIELLQELVASCEKVKVLGTRHSFNGIGDSDQNLISLQDFKPVITVSDDSRSVTVGAGVRYGQLCEFLHRRKLALPNLGSLPHISVAGACVTATHGSGLKNGILASSVSAVEFLKSTGDIVTLSKETAVENFYGAVVNLGALGVVTRLTLDINADFQMKQVVFQHLPFDALRAHYDTILTAAYSVSLFTNWKNRNFNQVWLKIREGHPRHLSSDFFGATAATTNLHPIIELDAEHCTQQMGVPGPWYERLPHFRMNFTPSSGKELQSEYFVPYDAGSEAIESVFEIAEKISPYVQISEVRSIAPDDFWLSPCYKRASLAIHFTWVNNGAAVNDILPLVEEKLAPFEVRTHWGKLFAMTPAEIDRQYEKLPDFRRLVKQYDPTGKFTNTYLKTYILS